MDGLLTSLRNAGLLVDSPILNGQINRVKVNGSKGKNGWYIARMVGSKVFATYGNWATGEKHKYPNSGYVYSDTEKVAWQKIVQESEAAEKERHKTASTTATTFLKKCKPAKEKHPYIIKKGIKPHSARQYKDLLILPVKSSGKGVTGYQSINESGEKRFLPGMKKKGCCHVIPGNEYIVLVCEGFSTGATLHEATGYKILVAMDCHNLYSVAETASKTYSNVLICADNDHKTEVKGKGNPGIKAAKKIKKELGLEYIYPKDIEGSDFNDMATEKSIEAVRERIEDGKTIEVYQPKSAGEIPQEIFNPPGLLKDIADYYNLTAVKPQPLFAIASGLILGSVLLGRRYVTDKQNYTSLYFIIGAKSGTGKDHVKQVVRMILKEANLEWMERGEGYTASNTVIKALERQALQLSFFEEIGQKLQEAASNPRSLSRGVFRKMLDIFSSCHSYSVGEEYSNGDVPRVERPALTMVGITTPLAFTNSINPSLIEQGFVNRLLPFLSKEERSVSKLEQENHEIPQKILKWIESIWLQGDLAKEGLPCLPDKEILIPFTKSAILLLNDIEEEVLVSSNELERYSLDDMLSRNREIVMRIALIVAVMDGCQQIEVQHVKWSHLLVKTLYSEYVDEIKRNVSGSDYETFKLLALNSLRKRGEKGVKVSEMPKLSPWSRWPKKLRNEILADLQESNIADSYFIKGQRGPGVETWLAIEKNK